MNMICKAVQNVVLIIPILLFCMPVFAQDEKPSKLIGMNLGVAMPAEVYDLEAIGYSTNLGFDYAYPVTDSFALGFYISLGGGVIGAVHPYSEYDRYYYPFKFSVGLLMETGDLKHKPFIFGVGPCTGLGFVDMDLFLPMEFRVGFFMTERWYMIFELVSGVSLAHETVYFEPSIRVGYNFGKKSKTDN